MENKINHISHIFNTWSGIPDVSHLSKIQNNYVHAFEHGCKDSITYVSYVIKNDVIIAFGSATYFGGTNCWDNYYIDSDDDNYSKKQQNLWKLWVEGLVSTEKGYGSIILQELEKWLAEISVQYNVERKVINIMSVSESVGFYEENGYVECYTGPRFGGTGNTRVAKAIGDFDIRFDIQLSEIDPYPTTNSRIECLEWDIARYILQGRRVALLPYIEIPKNIPREKYESYIIDHPFKEYITEDIKNNILSNIDEINS